MSDLLKRLMLAANHDGGRFAWIAEAAERIQELEDRLHERDLAVAALSQDRDEAYDRGVRDGIERVRKAVMSMPVNHFLGTVACEDALAAYEKEVGRE